MSRSLPTVYVAEPDDPNLKFVGDIYCASYNMRIALGLMPSRPPVTPTTMSLNLDWFEKKLLQPSFHVVLACHPQPVAYLAFEQFDHTARIHQFYSQPSGYNYADIVMQQFCETARQKRIQQVDLKRTNYAEQKYIDKWQFKPDPDNPYRLYRDLNL